MSPGKDETRVYISMNMIIFASVFYNLVANTYFQYKVTTPISGNYPSAKMTTDFRRSYYIELNSTNPKLRFLGQESEISRKECYFTIVET